MKFRILRGKHNQGERHPDGRPVIYARNDVVESETDLCKLNAGMATKKFERVDDSTPLTNPDAAGKSVPSPETVDPNEDTFNEMTVAELRQFAEQEEIDLGKARTKDEIIAVLRSH